MNLLLLACAKKKQQDTGSDLDESTTLSSTGPSDLNQISTTPSTVEVSGQIDNIYALADGSSVIAWGTNDSGNYTIWNVDAQTQTATELTDLPNASERSYNKPLQLQNGDLAICYQSDARFNGQDGTQHGVLIIDPFSGQEIADIPFTTASNPEGMIEFDGRLYILAANRQTDQVPSLMVVDSTNYNVIADRKISTDARNASDIEFYTDKNNNPRILISATSSTTTEYASNGTGGVLNNTTTGKVLVVNPNTLAVENSIATSANMGIDLSVDDENNLAVVSGVATEESPLAFGVVDLDVTDTTAAFDPNWIGDIISNEVRGNGAGGVFPFGVTAKQGFLSTNFIDGANRMPTPTILDLSSDEYIVLDADPALISTPVLDTGKGALVYAANGTSIDADSHIHSTVYFFAYE